METANRLTAAILTLTYDALSVEIMEEGMCIFNVLEMNKLFEM